MAETEQPPAAGDLELVRRFVNSVDLEAAEDEFADLAGWQTWAARNGFADAPDTLADLRRLVGFREALREALQANHDRLPIPELAATELDRTAQWSALRVRFTPDGTALASEATGMRAAAASVLARTATAMNNGTWSRLKICANDGCRWAFYDTSRSRTGQWCSMGVCGNRAKQARYKSRRVTRDR